MLPSKSLDHLLHNPFPGQVFRNRIRDMVPADDFPHRLARLASEHRMGHPEAFDGLVRESRERIFSMLLRSVKDPGTAEDLLQETYVRAYRGLESLKDLQALEKELAARGSPPRQGK